MVEDLPRVHQGEHMMVTGASDPIICSLHPRAIVAETLTRGTATEDGCCGTHFSSLQALEGASSNSEVCHSDRAADGTLGDALGALATSCSMARLSATSRWSTVASLRFIERAFRDAEHLRTMLEPADGLLACASRPSHPNIVASLEDCLEALEDAVSHLQNHHGLAHLLDIIDQGNADQASCELVMRAAAAHPPIIHDEATAAGIQALRFIVGPLNEIQVALADVRCAAEGRNIDNEPF